MRVPIWSHPRSRSTALERYFINRPEFTVHHETLAKVYFIRDRREPIAYSDIDGEEGLTYEQARELLLASDEKIVVHKDFPYHAIDELVADGQMFAADDCRNIVLIRHPIPTLLSALRLRTRITEKNFGYQDLSTLVDKIQAAGAPLLTIHADDLACNGSRTLRGICEYVGVPADERYLSWDPGAHPQWQKWGAWHTAVSESTGFEGTPDILEPDRIPSQYRLLVEESVEIFERLAAMPPRPTTLLGMN